MRPLILSFLPARFDDGGGFFFHADLLAAAEVFDVEGFEVDAEFFKDGGAAGDDGDVFQHGLAPIAKARGLDRDDFQRAAELVDNQRGESFACDIFGDDEQGPCRSRRPCRGRGGDL